MGFHLSKEKISFQRSCNPFVKGELSSKSYPVSKFQRKYVFKRTQVKHTHTEQMLLKLTRNILTTLFVVITMRSKSRLNHVVSILVEVNQVFNPFRVFKDVLRACSAFQFQKVQLLVLTHNITSSSNMTFSVLYLQLYKLFLLHVLTIILSLCHHSYCDS